MNSVSCGDRAAHVLDRRDPAQHLLDRDRDLRRVVDEQLPLVGVQQQLLHAAADDVARRLVAADEDQQRLVQHVVGAEPVAVDLGVHEHAHEVVGRLRLALRDRVRAELGVARPSRASPRAHCSSVALPLCALTMSSDQRSRSSRSSGATPSMSPIRIIGSGAAMSRDEVALAPLAHRVDDRVAHVADLLLAVAHAAGA